MDRVVLVTGGCGFIGTWVLRELLELGAQPIVIDAQPVPQRWQRVLGGGAARVVRADASLLDRDRLQAVIEQHRVTHIIHLAALLTPACQQDPWLGVQVNVMGSAAVFDAAHRSGRVRCVSYASSYAVYGSEARLGDTAPDRPPSFYGAFKQAVDLIAEQYWQHFGIASVAIRPHVVYGPERDQGLTAGPSLACRAAALGESYSIGYTGRVGYDYVEDVSRALVRGAFECSRDATIIDLYGEQATPQEFIRAIESIAPESAGRLHVSGPEIPASIPPQPRPITQLFTDWQSTALLDGVRQTVDFYRRGGR